MLYGYMITENRSDDYSNITNSLSLFFEHLAKWIFIPNHQSHSWIESLYKVILQLEVHKKKHPASYKGYVIADHLDEINNSTISRLSKNNNISIFKLNEVYSLFTSLDQFIDKNYVNSILKKYQQDESIILLY